MANSAYPDQKWLLQKPAYQDLHCLKGRGISGFSRTRVKIYEATTIFEYSSKLELSVFLRNYNVYLTCVIFLYRPNKIINLSYPIKRHNTDTT